MPDQPLDTAPSRPMIDDAWADRVADRVEELVAEVRRRSYGPVKTLATALVLGILIGAMLSLAAVLGAIALARLLNAYLGGNVFGGRVWPDYLIVGGIFCLVGLFLWSKRRRRS